MVQVSEVAYPKTTNISMALMNNATKRAWDGRGRAGQGRAGQGSPALLKQKRLLHTAVGEEEEEDSNAGDLAAHSKGKRPPFNGHEQLTELVERRRQPRIMAMSRFCRKLSSTHQR